MATKTTVFRVLSIASVEGIKYQPNMLVQNLPDDQAKALQERGMLSDKTADVNYCKTELNAAVLDHKKVLAGEQSLKPKAKAEDTFTEDDA
ncbi:hypothetical protein [Oceanobacter sp. 3_MG-2023]|uniref:hypothetical protein n=1 Tax=Oceanobacter sp. 3_MG-2023 TaxID=3062622 RepID=UPI0027358701|nr:hypothetical protein [Oceanobacter sp. 3_MG-2023]MDP2505389.1 hypothetical protein [Oceanobacter sp. 3_MG-2023]